MTSVGGTQYFDVEGIKEGTCSIVLEYIGPNQKTVGDTKTFTATVEKDLYVSIA